MQKTIIEGSDFHRNKNICGCGTKAALSCPCAILIEGNLNTVILKAALENVVNRHEILRTTF